MLCEGAVAATEAAIALSGITGDGSSEPAREGTAAHELGERGLQYADCNPVRKCEFWLGETISVKYKENGKSLSQDFVIDQDMADFVQVYVDQVMREPGELLIEQVVDLSEVYGVPGQKGTADAVKLDYDNNRIYVGDLKFGRGVMVFAEGNKQLYSYAAGVLAEHDLAGDWDTITVAIHQPRLHHYDEYTMRRAELELFMFEASTAAHAAYAMIGMTPDTIEKADDFTTLDADCSVAREAAEMSDELIGKMMLRADLITSTLSAWRKEGFRRVDEGTKVPGWKMVSGKKGRRHWIDEEEAKRLMKGARMKNSEMYVQKLLTAPAAEKVIAKKRPKVWTRLKLLIAQNDGSPSLAVESDPRPELKIADSESFQDTTDDMSDLL